MVNYIVETEYLTLLRMSVIFKRAKHYYGKKSLTEDLRIECKYFV